MGFESLPNGFRVDQPRLGVSSAADRFAPVPWAGMSGLRGLGAHQNSELPAIASQVSSQIASLKGLLDQIGAAISQYGAVLQADPTGVGVLGNAQGAAQAVQAGIDQLSAVLPSVSMNYGSFAGSDAAWIAGDAAIKATANIISQNRGVPAALSSAAANVQRANATAASQAAANQTAANNALTTALLQSQTLAGGGNFDGAIAALQAPNVVAAAQLLGRSGDIQSALAAISGQKQQADRAAGQAATTAAAQDKLNAQIQQCAAGGGAWTGTYCDMSAANVRAQQLAQQRAQCSAVGGTWDEVGQFCNMQAANAARNQAQVDAAAAERQRQIDSQNQALQQQAQMQQAQLAQQQAQWEAQNAAADRQAAAQREQAAASTQAQIAQACFSRGGTFDAATGNCDLSFVQQQAQNDRIIALLPMLSGNPDLLAQALARIFGLQAPSGSMTSGVPGSGGGANMSQAQGGYAQGMGPESF